MIPAEKRNARNRLWWETTLTLPVILLRAFMGLSEEFQRAERLAGCAFAQFLKINSELRYTWNIDKNQSLATRVAGGLIYSYGNSDVAPL